MIRENIRRMSAYTPPLEGRSAKNYLLLDFNERTVPVSPHINQALVRYIESNKLQQYPEYGQFLSKLAKYAGRPESELMITNGSDQGIDLVYRLVGLPGDEAIVPSPSFAMLSHSAAINGLTLHEPVYTQDRGYPLREVMDSINERTKVIVVCNPNSPTGTILPVSDVLRLAQAAPHAAILVDECYFEYAKITVKDYVADYPNLFITRTFSKTWGIPSLRLGYVISCKDNIGNLLKVRGPYDINRLAIVAMEAAFDNPSYMESYVSEVINVSMPLLVGFLKQKGVRYWPTVTNFILFYPPDGKKLTDGLEKKGILIRPRSGPGIEGTVRINVGTKEQTERLISALDELL